MKPINYAVFTWHALIAKCLMIACSSEAFYQQNKHGVLGLHRKCSAELLKNPRCQFLVLLQGLIPPVASQLLQALLICGAKCVGATATPGGCGVLLCLCSVTVPQGCVFRLGALASSSVGAVLVPSRLGATRGGSGAVARPSVGLSPPVPAPKRGLVPQPSGTNPLGAPSAGGWGHRCHCSRARPRRRAAVQDVAQTSQQSCRSLHSPFSAAASAFSPAFISPCGGLVFTPSCAGAAPVQTGWACRRGGCVCPGLSSVI